MKTSTSQFDLMITFMEQHGDLNKPTSNARGRISNIRRWEELAQLLNSDGSGDTKTTEKWRKVWSDYKNNTKKKAARLHRAATGTGGGPAVFAKLSDLEQRVLSLIGVQVATGLAVEEAGLSQSLPVNAEQDHTQMTHQLVEYSIETEPTNNASSSQLPPCTRAMSPPAVVELVQGSEPWNEAGPSTRTHVPPSSAGPAVSPRNAFVEVSLEYEHSPTRPVPSPSGQTTPLRARGRPIRSRGSPRRRLRPAQTEQATQHFLHAEERWREFKRIQHNDYMDIKREKNRIREVELQTQKEWQAVGLRVLDILNKLVDKYCKD